MLGDVQASLLLAPMWEVSYLLARGGGTCNFAASSEEADAQVQLEVGAIFVRCSPLAPPGAVWGADRGPEPFPVRSKFITLYIPGEFLVDAMRRGRRTWRAMQLSCVVP